MIKKKPSSFRTDLRPPLIAGAAIGAVLLALLVLLAFMSEGSNPIVPPKHLPFYALALFAVHLLTVGLILGAASGISVLASALMHNMSTILVVANSLRLMVFPPMEG